MNKDYFKILFAQIKLSLDYDSEKEFLVETDNYFDQMEEIINIISNNSYDVIIFPELSYHDKYNTFFLNNSINKIIVFGSVYMGNENFTVVYNNQKKYLVKKVFNSGVEPSIRFQENISIKDFFKHHLKDHTFKIRGKKFIVLNCAEYYKVAYFIARDEIKSKNLFGFLVPCANNNNQVFLNESMAIHNHNEDIYSFVVNSVATYKGEKYSEGGSYIFGILSNFERKNINHPRLNQANNICYLDNNSYIVEGMFYYGNLSKYFRSDNFRHTPKNFKIIKVGEKL